MCKEWMLQNLQGFDALFRVQLQHSFDQVHQQVMITVVSSVDLQSLLKVIKTLEPDASCFCCVEPELVCELLWRLKSRAVALFPDITADTHHVVQHIIC